MVRTRSDMMPDIILDKCGLDVEVAMSDYLIGLSALSSVFTIAIAVRTILREGEDPVGRSLQGGYAMVNAFLVLLLILLITKN